MDYRQQHAGWLAHTARVFMNEVTGAADKTLTMAINDLRTETLAGGGNPYQEFIEIMQVELKSNR